MTQQSETSATGSEDHPTKGQSEHSHPQVIDEQGEYLLLPLRDLVIFPNMVVTIPVDNAGQVAFIEETLPTQKQIVVCCVKDNCSDIEELEISDFYPVGTIGRVAQMMREDRLLILVLEAQERVQLIDPTKDNARFRTRVKLLQSVTPPATDTYWQAAVRNLRDSARKFVRESAAISANAELAINKLSLDNTNLLTDFLAANLDMPFDGKQALLQETRVVKRVDQLQKFLNEQQHITDLQNKLKEDVQNEFSEVQRKAYLREQLRAIQKELGEDDGRDSKIAELETRLNNAGIPDPARQAIDRELQRLQQISTASPEYSGIVDYLETVASLPWSTLSENPLDLDQAEQILERDHYGIPKVKQRIIEYLAVRKLNPEGRGPILCFVGPPGVGKTSLGQSIASALGRQFCRIALGGARDEAEIRGHRRTYIGAMPGRLIQELRRAGTANPVIMLDEIDKLGADFRGDPASALLEVLDPRQNHAFVDRYLDLPFDLSQVVFIATANTMEPIPAPLRDRMEIIQLSGYTPEEKHHIAVRYLIPRQLQENGINEDQCHWQEDALDILIQQYTREAGVRNLEREIGSVIRAIAASIARGNTTGVTIDNNKIVETLGPSRFEYLKKVRQSTPGIVNGLAYTPTGGEVLHIEAIRFPGTGKLTLTGQLGEVMRESVQAAESLLRNRADMLGIESKDFSTYDVHIHVPAGAIPKDGPSAGVAMFTALASLFSQQAVNSDVGMTGEITLQGLVLPIGGLKEKTLAALNAGIKTVLIPSGNKKDIPELAEQVVKGIDIIPVDNIDDVLHHALIKSEN